MSEIEVGSTQQSGTLETDAAVLTPDEAQPAAADQETGTTQHREEPPVTAEKRTISAKKLAANRANAQRSTGPTTPEGKEKSKFNAVKHGLTARYFPAVIQAETAEWEQFEAVRTDLYGFYQPADPIEELMVEKVTMEYLRYRRLVEREQVLCAHNRPYFFDIVNKLARYQTAINRQLFEAMRELERLQAQRKAKEAKEGESNGSSN
ncbi:MAG TPA: hypothetical protein VIX11_08105 [Candidatus Acidoferrum sp.]